MERGIVVVGGGLAGATAALTARRRGYDGPITLVGAEPHLPYSRPPLSKGYLRGEVPFSACVLHRAATYREHGVDLLLGERVTRLLSRRRRVRLASGEELPYATALVATGSYAAPPAGLPGRIRGLHTLRTLDDADRLRADARRASAAVVAGGGFVACEVAASLRQMGLAVTVVAPQARLMEPAVGPAVAAGVQALHEEHGVRVRNGDRVAAVVGRTHVEAVTTAGGLRIECELVVMGTGAAPALAGLVRAPEERRLGIAVDERAETAAGGLFAAGDVARRPFPRLGAPAQTLGHWNNAHRQGRVAGAAMAGGERRLDDVPSFWSDQFDRHVEFVGLGPACDRLLTWGDVPAGAFVALHLTGGRVTAASALGYDDRIVRPLEPLIGRALPDAELLRRLEALPRAE